MGELFLRIDDRLRAFIGAQQMFFVATAPTAGGHVNVSPKGLDTFVVVDDHTVAYLDLIGSGVETIAHLRDNGRITIMFCSFAGPPKILRLYGAGEVVEPSDEGFGDLAGRFSTLRSSRSVIRVSVERIADSCGFGVPLFDFRADRPQIRNWADKRSDEDPVLYQREKNLTSIDELPGLRAQIACWHHWPASYTHLESSSAISISPTLSPLRPP